MTADTRVTEEKLAEVRKALALKDTEPIDKTVKIIDDGTQLSIRIPKDFAEVLKLKENKNKFRFKFTFIKPAYASKDNTPKLKGELIEADD